MQLIATDQATKALRWVGDEEGDLVAASVDVHRTDTDEVRLAVDLGIEDDEQAEVTVYLSTAQALEVMAKLGAAICDAISPS